MIPARKHIPLLVLSMALLLATVPGSAIQDSAKGRWSGTIAAISGNEIRSSVKGGGSGPLAREWSESPPSFAGGRRRPAR